MKRVLLVIGAVLLGLVFLYEGSNSMMERENFKTALDSLDRQNDSLQASIANKNTVIDSLKVIDSTLIEKLAHQKPEIITIIKFIDSSKSAIDTYTEQELVSSLNKRYPEDTTSNLLAVAQPVLTSVVKDLVEFDGEKQLSALKDSIITIQEERINLKDLTIRTYLAKEEDYKGMILNKKVEVKTWSDQYDQLQKENKKLKKKFKVQKIISSAVVGTLAIFLIAR